MNKLKFYTIFNILNILITLYLNICAQITSYLILDFQNSALANIKLLCGLVFQIIYVTLKLSLSKIHINKAQKNPNSMIGEFTQFLINNPKEKNKILTIAFLYDTPFIIYFLYGSYDYIPAFCYLCLAYIILYAGGVLFFYIMLYREIDIKDGKVKTFF